MAGGGDARCLVDAQCDVIVAVGMGIAGVDSHAYAQAQASGPLGLHQCLLGVESSLDGRSRVGEGTEAGITLMAEEMSALMLHGLGDQFALAHEQLDAIIAALEHHGRRAFNVRHDKGHAAAWQIWLLAHPWSCPHSRVGSLANLF